MTDPARVLLTAAVLSASALAAFAWQVSRIEPGGPDRLIGELRLAQWAALLLAATGAISIGLALTSTAGAIGNMDVTLGVGFVLLAGFVLQSDPKTALLLVVGGFILHALTNLAHRPDLLSPEVMPRWYAVGCSIYDVCIAIACYWVRYG